MPVRVCVGTPSAIQNILKKSESSTRVLEEATEGFQMQILRDEDAPGDENLTVDKLTTTRARSSARRLDDLHRHPARASDIHIETGDDAVHVKYRIDGVLQQAMKPIDKKHPQHDHLAHQGHGRARHRREARARRTAASSCASAARRSTSACRSCRACTAKTRHPYSRQGIDQRAVHGAAARHLGWPEDEMRRFRKYIREPYGMVLVTGPTGSGKTTTLYAALSEIKTIEDKIITIEDPVEYQLRGITQIPINERRG
jgi:type IV pilus assembly protein PilB